MARAMGRNNDLLNQIKFGFWVRTKQAPYRAVRWERTFHDDGRETLRGRNWVEVLPHGEEERTPARFFAADVELAGPHDRLTYYPAANEPVCGWQEASWIESGEFCPRMREAAADGELEAFCRRHMTELTGSEGEETNAEPQGEVSSHP